jgi:hypothetical protein
MADKKWHHGQFTWRELLCPDVAKARGFYGELLGWSFEEMPMPTGPYTIAKLGDRQIAGLWRTPDGAPFPPSWVQYISVESADRAIAVATSKGAQVLMPAQDVPNVGRFAALMDPTGAAFSILQASGPSDPRPDRPALHDFCWETLNTTDAAKSKDFYGAVVGWTVSPGTGGMNMPTFSAGDKQVADIQAAQPGMHSSWLSHIVVAKLEAERDKAARLGGKVLMPLVEIEKVGRMAVVSDPAGAVFSLFEPG